MRNLSPSAVRAVLFSFVLAVAAPAKAQEPLQQAVEHLQNQRPAAAMELLRPLLKETPNNIDALFLFSIAAVNEGKKFETPQEQKDRLLNEGRAALQRILDLLAQTDGDDKTIRDFTARVRWQMARTLFEQGEYAESLKLLRPLAVAPTPQVDDIAVRFFLGRAAVNLAEEFPSNDERREELLDEAIAVFHAVLVNNPDFVRVRLELARAFFVKGEDELASREFDRVLSGDLPPPVIANVRARLLQIRARRQWDAYFTFAVAPAPDTASQRSTDYSCNNRLVGDNILCEDLGGARPTWLNVINLGAGGQTCLTFALAQIVYVPFDCRGSDGSNNLSNTAVREIVTCDGRPVSTTQSFCPITEDLGLRQSTEFFCNNLPNTATVTVSRPDGDEPRCDGFPSSVVSGPDDNKESGLLFSGGVEYQLPLSDDWRWRNHLDFSHLEYASSDSDQTFFSVKSGLRWLADRDSEINVLPEAGIRFVAGDEYSRTVGLGASASHRFSNRLRAGANLSYTRVYHRTNENSDGPTASASLNGSYLITPKSQVQASAGWSNSRPRSDDTSYSKWWGGGVNYALPFGLTMGASAQWRRTQYRRSPDDLGRCFFGGCAPDAFNRRMDISRTLRLSVLSRAFTIYGFSPQVSLVKSDTESNDILQRDNSVRAEMRFVRQF